MPYNIILYFRLIYFHVSNCALFSTKYSSTLILYRRSLDTFYCIISKFKHTNWYENLLKSWYHDPAICMCHLHLFYNICLPISTPLWMGWDPANWRWDNRLLPLSLSAQWGWSNHNQISQHPLHALTFRWDDHTGRYVVEMVKITAETDTNHIICKSMNPGAKWM